MKELVLLFDGTNLSPSPAAFDPEKLRQLNGHYLRETAPEELARLVVPFLNSPAEAERLQKLMPLYRERANDLAELAGGITPLLCNSEELEYDPAVRDKALHDEGKARLRAFRPVLEALADFSAPALEKNLHDYVETEHISFKKIGPPLRAALTGVSGGPPLPEIMQVLGKTESLARLDRATGRQAGMSDA